MIGNERYLVARYGPNPDEQSLGEVEHFFCFLYPPCAGRPWNFPAKQEEKVADDPILSQGYCPRTLRRDVFGKFSFNDRNHLLCFRDEVGSFSTNAHFGPFRWLHGISLPDCGESYTPVPRLSKTIISYLFIQLNKQIILYSTSGVSK